MCCQLLDWCLLPPCVAVRVCDPPPVCPGQPVWERIRHRQVCVCVSVCLSVCLSTCSYQGTESTRFKRCRIIQVDGQLGSQPKGCGFKPLCLTRLPGGILERRPLSPTCLLITHSTVRFWLVTAVGCEPGFLWKALFLWFILLNCVNCLPRILGAMDAACYWVRRNPADTPFDTRRRASERRPEDEEGDEDDEVYRGTSSEHLASLHY